MSERFEVRDIERDCESSIWCPYTGIGDWGSLITAFCDSGDCSRLDDAELEFELTDFERDLRDDDTDPFSAFSFDSTDDDDEFDADEPGRDSSLSISSMSASILEFFCFN